MEWNEMGWDGTEEGARSDVKASTQKMRRIPNFRSKNNNEGKMIWSQGGRKGEAAKNCSNVGQRKLVCFLLDEKIICHAEPKMDF